MIDRFGNAFIEFYLTIKTLNDGFSSTLGPNVAYNGNFGIDAKDDVGTYNYGHAAKTHALTSITNPLNGYNPPQHTITYTPFKKVSTLSSEGTDDYDATFSYGPMRNRTIMKVDKNADNYITKYYAGRLYEEKVDADGQTTKYCYTYLSGKAMGVFIDHTTQSDELYYTHTDYLGSIVALSNESGAIAEEYAYDAWGNRRNPDNWSQSDTRTNLIIDRGYTNHEHLGEFGLINMGGRMYDPTVAMFLSPDPFIQDGGNPLNYNRYSYGLNNSLKYVDPSGYKYLEYIDPEFGGEGQLRWNDPLPVGRQGAIRPRELIMEDQAMEVTGPD
jgi:RHS repeat-associated protein